MAEATEHALRGALRTCVYDRDLLGGLLDRAARYADSDALAGETTLLRKLRETCWEAYALTGDERALASYLRLLGHLMPAPAAVEAPAPRVTDAPELTALFLELLPLPRAEDRAALGRWLELAARRPAAEEDLPLAATLRAGALALAASELAASEPEVGLHDAALAARRMLPGAVNALHLRLRGLDTGSITANDLLHLDLALGCLTEMLAPATVAGDFARLLRQMLGREVPLETVPDGTAELLDLLLDSAEYAVLLASELWGELAAEPGRDLVPEQACRERRG